MDDFLGQEFDLDDLMVSDDLENENLVISSTEEPDKPYIRESKIMSLTDNPVNDLLESLDYIPLSLQKETSFIKKSKLSFYDDVDEVRQALFLDYYFDEFPRLKKKYDIASLDEKKEILETAIQNSFYYRDEFIKNNQRLIFSIAKQYKNGPLPLIDLIHEGNIGIIRALLKFDITPGYKFSTYATNWIRQSITRAIAEKGRTIRVPVHFHEKINKLNRSQTNFINIYGRKPTNEELSKETGLPLSVVEKIKDYLKYESVPSSLDMAIGEEGDTVLGDVVASEEVPLADRVETALYVNQIIEALENSGLSERSLDILCRRYGLKGYEPQTLEEIAKAHNLSRERIRQVEKQALTRLQTDIGMLRVHNDQVLLKSKVQPQKEKNTFSSSVSTKYDRARKISTILSNLDLSVLDEQATTVINMRYGLNGPILFEIDEISAITGIPKDEVYVIEKKALQMLAHQIKVKKVKINTFGKN